jgi:hypothetical protein
MMFPKIIFSLFSILTINSFLYSIDNQEILKKDGFIIKTNAEHKNDFTAVKIKVSGYTFINEKNNKIVMEISPEISMMNLFSLVLINSSIFDFRYEKKENFFFLENMLGEFDFNIMNTYSNLIIKINQIEILCFPAKFKLFSYPGDNIFINVLEGKISIKSKKNSLILIAGESLMINFGSIMFSDIKDIDFIRQIFYSEILSKSKDLYVGNNNKLENKKNKFSENKYYRYSNLFLDNYLDNLRMGDNF